MGWLDDQLAKFNISERIETATESAVSGFLGIQPAPSKVKAPTSPADEGGAIEVGETATGVNKPTAAVTGVGASQTAVPLAGDPLAWVRQYSVPLLVGLSAVLVASVVLRKVAS